MQNLLGHFHQMINTSESDESDDSGATRQADHATKQWKFYAALYFIYCPLRSTA